VIRRSVPSNSTNRCRRAVSSNAAAPPVPITMLPAVLITSSRLLLVSWPKLADSSHTDPAASTASTRAPAQIVLVDNTWYDARPGRSALLIATSCRFWVPQREALRRQLATDARHRAPNTPQKAAPYELRCRSGVLSAAVCKPDGFAFRWPAGDENRAPTGPLKAFHPTDEGRCV
jgi:hypothetical protein